MRGGVAVRAGTGDVHMHANLSVGAVIPLELSDPIFTSAI